MFFVDTLFEHYYKDWLTFVNNNIMSKIIGDNYENYILNLLKKQYEFVWLWKDVPESILFDELIISDYQSYLCLKRDIGIDILVKDKDSYIYVQCKNYSNNSICIHDLSGYLAFKIKYPTKTTKLYYSGNLSNRVMLMLYLESEYVHSPFTNIITDPNISRFEVRQYQIDAVTTLKNKKRSVLSLPCGMGKTYISYLLSKNNNNIIVFTPTKELAIQSLEFYASHLPDYKKILISCDGCRNIDILKSKITSNNIIVSTFKSCDIVNKMLQFLSNIYIVIDEYHNLSQNDFDRESSDMYKLLHSDHTILFVSATPKYLNREKILGSSNFAYSWNDAIKNKYINDFKIYLPDVQYSNLEFSDFLELFKLDNLNNNIPNSKLTIKMYFILRSLLYNGNKKCIIYLTNIDQAKESEKILKWMKELFNVQLCVNIIDCHTTKKQRANIMKLFNESGDLALLLNVQILNEGIDVPKCDSVFITKPNNNIENLIQRMSRCIRILPNKSTSNVYMWCSQKKVTKILDYINEHTSNEFINKINNLEFTHNNIFCKPNDKTMTKIATDDIEKQAKYNFNAVTENVLVVDSHKVLKPNNAIYDFLKKYSTMPNEFIDDFFSLYDRNTDSDDFVINLDIVAKWLKSTKGHLKETLTNSYIKNIDYISKKGVSTGGRPLENILLTPDCFKRLTMSSKTKKAEEVRTYFIQLEKHIDKYKNYIIDGLNAEVKNLRNNQRPKTSNKGGIIYVLKSTKDINGIYRIGKTKKFKERKNVHDSSHPDDMEILVIYETKNIDEVENCLKSILKSKQYRKRKEFYEIDLDVLKELINDCDKITLKVKGKSTKIKLNGGYFLMFEREK